MEIKEVGSRGVVFMNEMQEVSYLIKGKHQLILCDTSSDEKQMQIIEQYVINQGLSHKEWLLFNSHAHYDHIWGNSYLKNANIISSKACLNEMVEKAEYEKNLYSEPNREIIIKYPNITFHNNFKLNEEEIEFLYLPGHTIGCTICIDYKDQVIYVGDLIEDPVPYLMYHDLQVYLQSLIKLKCYDKYTLVNGHNGVVPHELIDYTIDYINNTISEKHESMQDTLKPIHQHNLNLLALDYCDQLTKAKLKNAFVYSEHRNKLWEFIVKELNLNHINYGDLSAIPNNVLKQVLTNYVSQLT